MTRSLLGRRGRLTSLLITLSLALSLACAVAARAQTGQEAGIQTHLMWAQYDDDAVARQLDRAKESGATILRVDVGWASVEQDGKGQYNQWYLRRLDNVVDQAGARGLKLLLTFWETPCWASRAPESLKQGCAGQWWDREVQRYAPANASDYGEALAYMAGRYKGRVAAWEIWNEPNHTHYLKADDPVARYAEMVKAGYPAAKAADPQATILAGSLADADYDFTAKLLDKGVAGNFDAWSVHPYSGDRSPLDRGDDRWIQNSFLRGVPSVRATLLRYGQNVPIWLTEFGWSTCTIRDQQSYANCVDPAVQARYLTEAYTQMRAWDYVKAGFWFNLQDTSDNIGDRVDNYGLLHTDGTPKPAFGAFKAAARLMGTPGPDASVQNAGTGNRTGSGSGSATGSGVERGASATTKRPTRGRVTLRVLRAAKRLLVKGNGPRGRLVKIRAYRYSAAKRRFAVKASHTVVVKVAGSGRYQRVFKKSSMRRGRWRITATLVGDDARLARVDIGKRRRSR